MLEESSDLGRKAASCKLAGSTFQPESLNAIVMKMAKCRTETKGQAREKHNLITNDEKKTSFCHGAPARLPYKSGTSQRSKISPNQKVIVYFYDLEVNKDPGLVALIC